MNEILKVENVVKVFSARGRETRAVDGVSFAVTQGTTFGLVGESGSGKSTVARCALRLIDVTSGTSIIEGADVSAMSRGELRRMRAVAGMVFQNPVAALNPRMTIRDSIAEPLRTHTRSGKRAIAARVDELLDEVGLSRTHAARYPHQLSGGQCQRVGIARALATRPRLLVLDEPTSALDVSVQAQVLNLLQDLRAQHDLSYLLISHDLDVVRYMSDEVGVMRRGQLVESGPASEVLVAPRHEYTQQLLAAMPETPGAIPLHAAAPR
ncbi:MULTISPECIES: ATP-binding cassette domain-containing protein [unclassified Leucobacter]|uniref:ATP-binding cassette domain-containing protein n=1 Tax=unclassified Leucobacter TaxID=2621730 RepID=UPI00165D3298|nr:MULTISPECIES: ATP-binding cassette domain-containing protein [unclassified Leucobacter]MBC9936718.1 ABC transporter ATP-binding protein [Leucobacter sp. cx-87]